MHKLSVIIASLAVSSITQAQLTPTTNRFPAGKHELAVRGWFQGEEMEPWDAEYSVADTLMNGRPALRVTYNSRRTGDRWNYQFVASWTSKGEVDARWVNARPQPNSCDLTAANGRITGQTSSGSVMPVPFTGSAIPDFALGAYVATLPLDEGAVVKLVVFRCTSGAANQVMMHNFTGTVRSGQARRGWGDWEPAWIVEGSKDYPSRITIAKSDRVVLHTRTVQGNVGHSEDSYVGTVREKR
jgi:hypothetical protein